MGNATRTSTLVKHLYFILPYVDFSMRKISPKPCFEESFFASLGPQNPGSGYGPVFRLLKSQGRHLPLPTIVLFNDVSNCLGTAFLTWNWFSALCVPALTQEGRSPFTFQADILDKDGDGDDSADEALSNFTIQQALSRSSSQFEEEQKDSYSELVLTRWQQRSCHQKFPMTPRPHPRRRLMMSVYLWAALCLLIKVP